MRNHILALTASNVKSLIHIEIQPDGTMHTIAGKNGQGKTAFLEAIEAALVGLDPDLIRHGSNAAEVILRLSSMTIRRVMTADGKETLWVTDADGRQVVKAKDLLKALVGPSTFSPVEWVQLGGGETRGKTERLRKQRDQLIQALPLTVTAEQIAQAVTDLGPEFLQILAGFGNDLEQVNFEQHALEVCASLHKLTYDARQEKNSEEKRTKTLLEMTPVPEAAPPAEPLSELEAIHAQAVTAWHTAKASANVNAGRAARIQALEGQIFAFRPFPERDETQGLIDAVHAALVLLESDINTVQAEIIRLQQKHDEMCRNRNEGQNALRDLRQRLFDLDQRDRLQAELDSIKADGGGDQVVDLATIEASMKTAERNVQNKRAQEAYDRAFSAHVQAKDLSDRYTRLVELFRDSLPKQLLEQTHLPVPGLAICEDHIEVNGTPLHMLSTSEQIKVGVAIASALAPACGFVLVDGAESLDPDSRVALREIAQELDLQLILTLVDPDAIPSDNTTVIQNGEVVTPMACACA